MHIEAWKLAFIYWFGGGMLIFFAWASVLGEAVIGSRHRAVRAALSALTVLGVIHPVAAFASVDLARLCSSLEDRGLQVSAWARRATVASAAASLPVAVLIWQLSETA